MYILRSHPELTDSNSGSGAQQSVLQQSLQGIRRTREVEERSPPFFLIAIRIIIVIKLLTSYNQLLFLWNIYISLLPLKVRQVILFYISANSLLKDSLTLLCLHLIWYNVLLWLNEENPFPHINVLRKWKSILIAFADNCG